MPLPVRTPASFEDVTLNFEQISAAGMYVGSGVPTFQAVKGNYYFRRDVPGLYVNTANGSNWVAFPVALTAAAWTAPTLINSWANLGGGYETAAYLKDPFGFVHLKGAITTGATGTTAFVLPAGFRPGATTLHASGAALVVNVQIDTAGNVKPFLAGGGPTAGLSGITFLAEN